MLKHNLIFLFLSLLLSPLLAQESFYVIDKNVVLRAFPSISSEGVDMLMYGEMVYALNEMSEEKASIDVNGTLMEGAWVKIQTQSDQQAWVHEKQLSRTAPMPAYAAWVDQLRIRTEGNLQSKVITKLRAKEEVFFTGYRSRKREKVKLRGKNEAHYWLEVRTAKNETGWVYGGGLKPAQVGNTPQPNTPGGINNPDFNLLDPSDSSNTTPVVVTNPWEALEVSTQEGQALRNWWNGLSQSWKDFFSEVILKRPVEFLREAPTNAQLKYIKTLKRLDLDCNDKCGSGPFYGANLQDLNGVSQLSELEELSCNYLKIRDLRPLAQLKNLKILSLNHTDLESLQGLEALSNLRWLDISLKVGATLDLNPVKALSQLEALYLEADQLDNFDPLRSTLQLKKLIVKIPDLRSLSGLNALYNLEHLSIKAEQSELDLRPLTKLNKLKYCLLHADAIEYMRVLAEARQLRHLLISTENNSFNGTILRTLPALEELDLQATKITALEHLSQLQQLRALHLNKVDSFDFKIIKNCRKLHLLEVETPHLIDLAALNFLPELSRLNLKSDAIQRLTDLPKLPALTHLMLSSRQVVNLEGLGRFERLFSADFSACQNLQDLKHVKLLENIEFLYIPTHIQMMSPEVQRVVRPNLDIRYEPLGGC